MSDDKISISRDRLRMIGRALGALAYVNPIVLEQQTGFSPEICQEAVETAQSETDRWEKELREFLTAQHW